MKIIALPQDGDGFVRCIGMSVEIQARKPAQVARVWFSKIRVDEEGRIDPHHRHETVKMARAETQRAETQQAAHAESSLVAAAHRFALRRLSHLGEWRPEERDLNALRALVNTKAGKQML